ncbi:MULTISPECIES: DUF1127 domain-containing protein [unclassified Bosea (in: a-proteobacteria)]|uniref:DUF1127 domain-containing protein n=1 Tax=unclassified Bosea (in: a-proteobacteria) TaxID=2653178 RepID=UPI000F75FBA3|nr:MULTISPECIES: DUF1127 domain-containing protein [unclassified Bosea (in: a-proteobacteria)]AZO76486.1 hypothetical protein BLM15_01865 [Bosea sp. Tri-49]RXT26412.1 hypothetical protein B5U98_07780 [Bosea sp. Tri-39]RXT31653.1 hypothetical protein B5U99_23325 [Bosea sp. Tri-54]
MISFIIGSAKPVLAMVDGLGRILGGISHWLQSRRDYRTLCDMTERDLRDLGLRDSDLRDATAAPFFGDPTAIISLRVEERRGLAGGESVDQVLRGLSAGTPARPERIAKESDSAVSSRVVFLRAAE